MSLQVRTIVPALGGAIAIDEASFEGLASLRGLDWRGCGRAQKEERMNRKVLWSLALAASTAVGRPAR